ARRMDRSGAARRRWMPDGIFEGHPARPIPPDGRMWTGREPGVSGHLERTSEMCGIAGAIDLNGRRAFPASRLLAMTGAIAHRGPDDEQIHLEPGLALGARRLSIVDLAGGRQPISNEDGSIWVTQNGELFEYPELQAELA